MTNKLKELTDQQGEFLLKFARTVISRKLNINTELDKKLDTKTKNNNLYEKRGTFVTLHKDGNLRGCIGTLEPNESIIDGIKDNAINAAFKDPRFSPVKKNEINNIDLEISILTIPEKLDYFDTDDLLAKLKPFIHGVIIQNKHNKATFLPQVWDQLPDKKEFLSHICTKAGLPSNEWQKGELEVMTYQVQYFKE